MATKRRIVTTIVVIVIVAVLGGGGFLAFKRFSKGTPSSDAKVYVQKVSNVNTVSNAMAINSFAGLIEAQKSVDVKFDTSKTIAKVLVKNDDVVKKGDKLITYDVDAIQLELDQGNLEIERMQSEIESNKTQIAQLEKEKIGAGEDAVVAYNTQILSLQSDNAKAQYDIKAKTVEVKKLEKSIDNAFVTASADGTIKNVKSVDELSYGENSDVLMQISAEGDYLVKGTINEQNISQISEGSAVILKSRVDDTQWAGVISSIDTTPQENNDDMYDYGNTDETTSSSKYTFYVTPESLDGFLLGQHVVIELDNGQESEVKKTGIWLYSDFIITEGSDSYVWVKDDDGLIEMRKVEIGKSDDDKGDCEITSGLESDDYIAYPAKYIEEGMETTTNQSDVSVADNDLTADEDDMDYDMDYDMGEFDEDYEDYDEEYSDDFEDKILTEEQMSEMTEEEIEEYYNNFDGGEVVYVGEDEDGEIAGDEETVNNDEELEAE